MSKNFFKDYSRRLSSLLVANDWTNALELADALYEAWITRKSVFICGNGGSAANAIHFANDLLYGVTKYTGGKGMKVHALSANQAVTTCLANDVGYDDIYSKQLETFAEEGDILVVLSGSGNSPNVLKALEVANALGMATFAVLGYSGGEALKLAKCSVYFNIQDMQIAEDCQQILFHMMMQYMLEKSRSLSESIPNFAQNALNPKLT